MSETKKLSKEAQDLLNDVLAQPCMSSLMRMISDFSKEEKTYVIMCLFETCVFGMHRAATNLVGGVDKHS